ncbi:hypothetical protein [Desertibacillus haloalkaliphilus]|uniref:hypothetical protein n=1 Tax=Desertibacillus haloalkaliphilus TaxID=1328930 RepID=UPI001C26D05D|nr:hypothetical protein [Desertibacillus haloalkaliphilus]MBU8905237.1 hypothetical protein [Desertibacillus haloalkaliphilus]
MVNHLITLLDQFQGRDLFITLLSPEGFCVNVLLNKMKIKDIKNNMIYMESVNGEEQCSLPLQDDLHMGVKPVTSDEEYNGVIFSFGLEYTSGLTLHIDVRERVYSY